MKNGESFAFTALGAVFTLISLPLHRELPKGRNPPKAVLSVDATDPLQTRP